MNINTLRGIIVKAFRWLPGILLAGWMVSVGAETGTLRLGITPVFLDDQPAIQQAWKEYLELRLKRPVSFVQRGSYREIIDLLLRGKLDAAWICGLPYVENKRRLVLVAAPVYQGEPTYRSYLVVSKNDKKTQGWADLRAGSVFAFSDPDSNSGSLYPRVTMRNAGIDPDRYFRKTLYAHGHSSVVQSVAEGVADAGSVASYVWDTIARDHPEITGMTRIAARSETFGAPPVVARADLPANEVAELRAALKQMADAPEGKRALRLLNLDGFVDVPASHYESVELMARSLGR